MTKTFVHQMLTKMAYANSTDPDQTAPEGSTLFAIPLNILIYTRDVRNELLIVL